MAETHFRTCNLCEAICGIAIEHENGRILSIRGDEQDPFSRGHICPKAVALKDIQEDADRLKLPVRRTAGGWREIPWDDAFREIAERTKDIQTRFGRNAVAVFQGNPSVHNLGTMLFSRLLLKALRTQNNYSATSVDQLPHHFAAQAMLGHPFLLPIPDIDRTDFFLILGGNPLASNGSLMTAPGVARRIESIKKRGGKVVLIDPRRTETAGIASEHFFIKPGTDVFLLLAIVSTIFAEDLAKPGRLAGFTDGVERLREISEGFTPEKAAVLTAIEASAIRRIAVEFGNAPSAVCYGRMGVSVQRFGGLCHWLINSINVLTGNFDRAGGAMFTAPAIDVLAIPREGKEGGRWRSRVRALPEFMGELPVAALSEEILTEGEGKIRALFTSCGNPVLSTPNGKRLDEALEKLDFMVSVDFYINETTRHADIILPPATNLESSHYDVIFNTLAVRNVAKYSAPLFAKPNGARYDWEILQELAHHLTGTADQFRSEPPEIKLDPALRFGRYGLSVEKLLEHPHGIDLGALAPCLPERLFTDDKRIDLAPEVFISNISRLKQSDSTDDGRFPFALIGRRHLRDNNSWLHNSHRLVKGKNRCTLLINPADATDIGIADKQLVKVSSRVGAIEIEAEFAEQMMRGAVSIPHGYGHGREGVRLDTASQFAGASINDLTDEQEIDELTGNAAFSNVHVRIAPVDADALVVVGD